MKKALATGAALLLAAAVAGMLSGAGRRVHAATTTVGVQDDLFNPASVTISVGDSVQWNWTGSNPHTVSSTGAESFDSGAPQTAGSFSHAFNTIGSFGYLCAVHGAAMSGTVVVQAAPATNTPTFTPTTTGTPAATNTPGPTNMPGTTTPTRIATGTPLATGTPAPSATGAVSTATAAPAQAAAAPSIPGGGTGAGTQLPRTGDGAAGATPVSWWSIALAAAGLAILGGAALARRCA